MFNDDVPTIPLYTNFRKRRRDRKNIKTFFELAATLTEPPRLIL
jgi:hypothetical protein